jgi:hypothetical protein
MVAIPRPSRFIYGVVSLALPLWLLGACGSDSAEPEGPTPIEGAYALIIGPRTTLFSLAPDEATVLCRPKPGLQVFEFEASSGGSQYLRFSLADYAGPGDYAIEYEPGGVDNWVEVGFPADGDAPAGYKYKFFQFVRADLNVTYRSHCAFTIEAEPLAGRTRFVGSITCGALWADFDSVDYLSQPLNGFADLLAKFECEVPT